MRRSPVRSRPTRRNPEAKPCARREYWGRGGAGMMFVCSEDRTVLLLLRAEWVEQGGTWGVPGGGIGEGFFSTPMKPIDDPAVFLRKAVQEVEEECGSLPPGFSETQILGTTQYEDCGFRYRTFIVDVTAEQKAAWHLVSDDGETDAFVWFPWADVLSGQPLDDADQHFGVVFTMKNLPVAVASRFGRSNPRRRLRRNPDAPVRFPSGAEAERAALAARGAVLANPEFRAWFGKSKVVDADGKPLVVYHGTQSVFTAFGLDLSLFGGSGRKMSPTWFSESPEHAGYFAREAGFARGSIMPAYLSIERPLVVKQAPAAGWNEEEKEKVLKRAKRGSHDGIIFTDMQDLDAGRATTYVVFSPTQIKSATGNRGTFDPEEADIRHNPLRRALSRPARRLRRNPEDRALIRDLLAQRDEFNYALMETGGDDPDETTFDPMEYPICDETLEAYLGLDLLGWGGSRIVVRLPTGNVAKVPWTDDIASNDDEWQRWQEASDSVREMLLPPIEYVSGVLVFPFAEVISDYDDPELEAARARLKALYVAGEPGADVRDIHAAHNWGRYTDPVTGKKRVVLIDYAE